MQPLWLHILMEEYLQRQKGSRKLTNDTIPWYVTIFVVDVQGQQKCAESAVKVYGHRICQAEAEYCCDDVASWNS